MTQDEIYCGPSESLARFLDGAVITHREFVTDDSPWAVHRLHPARLRRLKYMVGVDRCETQTQGVCCCRDDGKK